MKVVVETTDVADLLACIATAINAVESEIGYYYDNKGEVDRDDIMSMYRNVNVTLNGLYAQIAKQEEPA